jgi:hypothetical protein
VRARELPTKSWQRLCLIRMHIRKYWWGCKSPLERMCTADCLASTHRDACSGQYHVRRLLHNHHHLRNHHLRHHLGGMSSCGLSSKKHTGGQSGFTIG